MAAGMHSPWIPIRRIEMPDEWVVRLREGHCPAVKRKVARRLGLMIQEIEFHMCVELPDYPLAREWMQWYTSPTRANAEEDVPVEVDDDDEGANDGQLVGRRVEIIGIPVLVGKSGLVTHYVKVVPELSLLRPQTRALMHVSFN